MSKPQTNEQSAVNAEKRTDRRKKQGQKPVNVKFFTGLLSCIRGETTWRVVSLNESRKVVQCPVCGADNDIQKQRRGQHERT